MRALKTRLFLLQACALTLLLLGIAACGGGDDDGPTGANTAAPASGLPGPSVDRSANPLKVVVSLPVFADMARIVGGNQVQVTALIPPGANPHTYVPSDDMADPVAAADMIFYNGLDLDGPTQRFIEQHLAPRPPLIIDIVRNIPSPSTKQPVDRPIYAKEAGDNPHLYLDPVLAPTYAETLAHSMIIKDGANTGYYEARFAAYKQQIQALNTEIAQKLSEIPPENKALLITDHNSLIWFAKRYGLTVAGTLQDDGEAGLRDKLASLKPPAVFTETGSDSAVLTQLANEAGVQVCNIDTDNIADGKTSYLAMMENTADEIASCLK